MYLTSGNANNSVGFQNNISAYSGHTYDGSRSAANSAWDAGSNVNCKAYFHKSNSYAGASFYLTPNTGDGYMLDNVGYAPIGFDDKLNSGRFLCG